MCGGFLNFPLEKLYKVCMKMLSGCGFLPKLLHSQSVYHLFIYRPMSIRFET